MHCLQLPIQATLYHIYYLEAKNEQRITYLILNVITIEDFSKGCSQILAIMSSWQFLKCENLTLQLPFVRMIYWRVNIMTCNSEVWIICLWCPCIKGYWHFTGYRLVNILAKGMLQRQELLTLKWFFMRSITSSVFCIILSWSLVRWGILLFGSRVFVKYWNSQGRTEIKEGKSKQ